MTSAAGPQGWGRTDGLLVRQPLRAEARHLLLVSGSLTWFRRPRLASPESTNEVEASHPLVKVPPPVYRARPGRRPGRVRRVPGSAHPPGRRAQPTRRAAGRRPGTVRPAERTIASTSEGSTAPSVWPPATTRITREPPVRARAARASSSGEAPVVAARGRATSSGRARSQLG